MYSTGERHLCARSLHLYTTTLIFSPQQSQFSIQGMRNDTSWDFILLQIENNKNLLKKKYLNTLRYNENKKQDSLVSLKFNRTEENTTIPNWCPCWDSNIITFDSRHRCKQIWLYTHCQIWENSTSSFIYQQ